MASNEELLARLEAMAAGGELDAALEKLSKLTREQYKYIKDSVTASADLKTHADAALAAGLQRLEQMAEERRLLKEELEQTNPGLLRQHKIKEESDKILIELAKEKKRLGEDLTEEEEKRLEIIKKADKAQKSIAESLKRQYKASVRLTNSFTIFEGASKHSLLNIDSIESALEGMAKTGFSSLVVAPFGMLEGFAKNILNSMVGLVIQLDKLESTFRQNTGASKDFAREVTNSYEATRELGVTAEQANASWLALRETYTDFTFDSTEVRREIGDTANVLARLGVTQADFAKGMQISTKMFGMTGTAAARYGRELNTLARDLGVAPAKIASDFANMGGQLAKLGKEAPRVFKEMQRVFKITGFEATKLLAITDKFDTFEGAAEMAGNLNAALGGNFVNAMDMMMETDPVERFDTLRETLLNTVGSFDNMSYYQKKFFTEQMGLESVGDLALMMKGNYDKLDGSIGQTSESYEEQAQLAADMLDVTTQLKMLLIELVGVMMPVIDSFRQWLDENKESIKYWSKFLFQVGKFILYGKALHKIVMALKFAYAALGNPFKKLIGWIATKLALTQADTEATAANTGGLQTFIAATNTAGKGTMAFAGAMAIMAAGIAVVILAFAELVESFGQAGDNAGWAFASIVLLTGGIVGLAFGMKAFGAAMGVAGKAAEKGAVGIGLMALTFASLALILEGVAAVLREVNTLMGKGGKTSLTVSGAGMSSLMETMATRKDTFGEVAVSFERIAESILSVDKTLPKFTRMFQAGKAFAAIETAFRAPAGGGTAPAGGGGGGTQTLTIPIHIGERKLETWVVTIADGQITKRVEEESLKAIGAL